MCCLLIPILTGLISAILGYLLGRLFSGGNNNNDELIAVKADRDKHLSLYNSLSADVDGWKTKYGSLETDFNALKLSAGNNSDWEAKIAGLQTDLNACNIGKSELSATINSLQAEIASLKAANVVVDLPFDAEAAALVFGKKVVKDDLKLVEGIGPKIEELFHAAGITTWKSLSETSVERCREILDGGGEHYQIHDPGTWPKQCEMMYKGLWQELKEWQDILDGGKV
ncbi:MAG: hypothetical protein K1X55_13875 [Chitinophagales bacterium]|nr:hypothetical protein [Chitinophagales bacterium]